jgi:hypothetical protein
MNYKCSQFNKEQHQKVAGFTFEFLYVYKLFII